MPIRSSPSKTEVLNDLPQVGAQLTRDLRLPTGAHPQEGAHSLQVRAKPEPGNLISFVNTMSSVDVVMFLQRLSSDEIRQLQQSGRDLKAHDLTSRIEHALLVERLAESFHLVQSKSILAVNFIGPERWRGVIKNQDARNKQNYANLPEDQRENLRSNVHLVARNLAALPSEALTLIDGLRGFAPQGQTWVEPASSLADHVAKRAVERNHDAWRFRKRLEGNPHDDISKNVTDLDPRMRLFAGLMGLGTFQMLREAGVEAITTLVRLGDEVLRREDLDVEKIRADIHSKRIVVGVPFKDGSFIHVSPDLMAHFRDYHHGLWLTNRTLSWLLPAELHQPQREEHAPIEVLDPAIANQTCIHIIALATSLAEDARTNTQTFRDLMTTAAPGNPFELNAGLFNGSE